MISDINFGEKRKELSVSEIEVPESPAKRLKESSDEKKDPFLDFLPVSTLSPQEEEQLLKQLEAQDKLSPILVRFRRKLAVRVYKRKRMLSEQHQNDSKTGSGVIFDLDARVRALLTTKDKKERRLSLHFSEQHLYSALRSFSSTRRTHSSSVLSFVKTDTLATTTKTSPLTKSSATTVSVSPPLNSPSPLCPSLSEVHHNLTTPKVSVTTVNARRPLVTSPVTSPPNTRLQGNVVSVPSGSGPMSPSLQQTSGLLKSVILPRVAQIPIIPSKVSTVVPVVTPLGVSTSPLLPSSPLPISMVVPVASSPSHNLNANIKSGITATSSPSSKSSLTSASSRLLMTLQPSMFAQPLSPLHAAVVVPIISPSSTQNNDNSKVTATTAREQKQTLASGNSLGNETKVSAVTESENDDEKSGEVTEGSNLFLHRLSLFRFFLLQIRHKLTHSHA
jgi:hypothetical protein